MMFWNALQSKKNVREEQELLLQSLEEGVIIVDEDLNVTAISTAALSLFKKRKREIIGEKLGNLQGVNVQLLVTMEHLLETAMQRAIAITDSILIEGKKKIYLELMALPKVETSGAILVFQDKSSHYKAVEMGKDFVANASHELKTPITIIKGFAETLQDMGDLPKEIYLDIIDKIVRSCQRMETLVKNLLTLADLENLSRSRFTSCDVKELLLACRENCSEMYPQCKLHMEMWAEDVFVLADPDLLGLALWNLTENAVKYSKDSAEVTLVLEVNPQEVVIQVKDTGMGIPEEALEHIFERFYTVNKAYARRLGGSGLGLSIVKNIIEKHEGEIQTSSILGEGTTFSIFLPRQEI